ncbi:MAG: DUF4426 domain-containing protein [Pseudomonadota bacterium]
MRGLTLWLLSFLFSCATWLGAETAQAESATFGEYTVHYIAVNTTFLTPEIAAQYRITRSNRRAFLNIAVLHNNADGSTTPVTAILKGGKRNLMQQSADIPFTEIREGDAIYYIGQFDFSNAENLRLTVEVQPEGKGDTHPIEWTTQLYSD